MGQKPRAPKMEEQQHSYQENDEESEEQEVEENEVVDLGKQKMDDFKAFARSILGSHTRDTITSLNGQSKILSVNHIEYNEDNIVDITQSYKDLKRCLLKSHGLHKTEADVLGGTKGYLK